MKNLKLFFIEKELSLKEASKKLKIPYSRLSAIKNGLINPNLKEINKLEHLTGKTIKELKGGEI